MQRRKALFLDRDGTLIRDAHYLKDPEQVEIIPSAGPSLEEAKKQGYLLFLHTNQSGIARGYHQWSDVLSCNRRMLDEFNWPNDFFDEICIAPEYPDQKDGYRKPSPKFEEEMIRKFSLQAAESWVVGDKWIDAETGLKAGMRGALVKTGKPIDEASNRLAQENQVPIYLDLAEFIHHQILRA